MRRWMVGAAVHGHPRYFWTARGAHRSAMVESLCYAGVAHYVCDARELKKVATYRNGRLR